MAERKTIIPVGVPEGVELLRGPVGHMYRPPECCLPKKWDKSGILYFLIRFRFFSRWLECAVMLQSEGRRRVIRAIDVEDLKSGNFKKEEHEHRWHEPTCRTRSPGKLISADIVFEERDRRSKSSERRTDKTYILREALEKLLWKGELSGKFLRSSPEDAIITGDSKYYCSPLEDAASIIDASGLECKKWVREAFDCDDFAYVLKAHFAEAAYAEGSRDRDKRPGHCFGIVFATVTVTVRKLNEEPKTYRHALNWMVNDDLKVRFVEPQAGYLIDPQTGQVFRVDPQTGQEVPCREGDPKTVEVKDIDIMLG